MTLRYLSLFSGVGGFDLGFDRAGMVCAGQVEIDKYCRKVLAKHWPDVKRMSDVREVKGDEFGTVDVICGGFPCQPHSEAGKRRGAADDRNLWPEYSRLVDAIRPRWVVGENVPGLAYTMLDQIISDLEHLQYEVVTFDIPAIAFDAPHIRRRLFIIAHAKSARIDGGIQGKATQRDKDEQELDRLCAGLAHAEGVTVRPGLCPDESPEKWWRRFGDGGSTPRPWPPESGVGRMAHGVPNRVDRLRALGNAVVPQVAEWLGRRIVEVNE